MMRTLVDRALEKAKKAEAEGNKEEADKWLAVAERADKAYDKLEAKTKEVKIDV